jgi:hypothetical protein
MRKETLNSAIKAMDDEMALGGIPVEERPLRALLRLSRRYQLKITSRPDDEIYAFVFNWYERNFGNRLNLERGIGVLAILIRNDLFKMAIPMVYGQADITVDPNIDAKNKVLRGTGPEPAKVYVLNCIEGLTKEDAGKLSPVELKELMLFLHWGMGSFQSMKLFPVNPRATEALKDIQSAVDHLFSRPQDCGQSKRASLRAVENFLVAYVTNKGGRGDAHQHLEKLLKDAHARGLPELDTDNLEALHCGPDVLSGKTSVNVPEAVEAHHASIELCGIISSSP